MRVAEGEGIRDEDEGERETGVCWQGGSKGAQVNDHRD